MSKRQRNWVIVFSIFIVCVFSVVLFQVEKNAIGNNTEIVSDTEVVENKVQKEDETKQIKVNDVEEKNPEIEDSETNDFETKDSEIELQENISDNDVVYEETENIVEEKVEAVEVIERVEAPYEQWLAAAMIMALSMQYPDFAVEEIYLTGETPLNEKMNSQGVYIVFTSAEEKIILHSKPLEKERQETGTIDLYTADLGFATFESIIDGGINTEDCKIISLEVLDELISQSLLVSIYEH